MFKYVIIAYKRWSVKQLYKKVAALYIKTQALAVKIHGGGLAAGSKLRYTLLAKFSKLTKIRNVAKDKAALIEEQYAL